MARSLCASAVFVVTLAMAQATYAVPVDIGSLEWAGCSGGQVVFGSMIDDSFCTSDPGPGNDGSYSYFQLTNFLTAVGSVTVDLFSDVEILVDTTGSGFDATIPLGDVDANGLAWFAPLGQRVTVTFTLPGLDGTLQSPILLNTSDASFGLITFDADAPTSSVPEPGTFWALAVGLAAARCWRRARR